MFATKVSYEDFNGNQCEETLCFYLNEAEIPSIKMFNEVDEIEGIRQRILAGKPTQDDVKDMMETIKELILASYGEKSEDGKHFRKNAQIREDFENSAAFPALFMEIYNDPTGNKVNEFIQGVMPKSLMSKIDAKEFAALTNLK